MFQYQNPVIAFLVKISNMLIVSFYWLLCCIPVVTVLPSCAALYKTVNQAVFTNGRVTKTFFTAFRQSLRPGIALSAVLEILAALIYLGIRTGLAVWSAGVWGAAYMALGVLIGILFAAMLVWTPAVLSRFEGNMRDILRLALYFSGRKLLRSGWYAVLLGLACLAVDFFPLLLLVVPAVYTDLTRGGMERSMQAYIDSLGLEEAETEGASEEPAEEESVSLLDADRALRAQAEEAGYGKH